MWREEPRELAEAQHLAISLFGVLLALASLRLMTVGLSVNAREVFMLLSLAPVLALYGGWYPKIQARFSRRLALRTVLAQEPGPKFLVQVTLRAEGRELGEDTGILSLMDGCLRYQGLRTEFSLPKDLVKRLDGNATKVGVQVEEKWVWIEFRELERLEPRGVFSDLPYAFGNFWIGPSAGELRLPPAEKAPKIDPAQRRRSLLQFAFWVTLSALGIYEGRSLASRGMREAQMILAITFAATALAAALAPVVRLARAYRSIAPLSRPESASLVAPETAIPVEETVSVSATR